MESFVKTIDGRKFKFEPQQLGNGQEWIYHVESKDDQFVMKLDKNQNWKIKGKVNFVIKELEDDFANAIDNKNG